MQKETGIYWSTQKIQGRRAVDVEGHGDIWDYKDDTRNWIRWDMLNGTGMVHMAIQGGYQ